jgi:asparagine synthase (glutamine-hydrolysing)
MRDRALKMAKTIRHRGPDGSGMYSDDHAVLAHERLSIVDVEHGTQPLTDGDRVLVTNGEIYTHKELRAKLKKDHHWKTESECEVILHLYDEYGADCVAMLSGIFAFALYDKKTREWLIARDHIGIIPLYIGWDKDGIVHVASEMKALDPYCEKIQEFPPGHYFRGKEFVQWYAPSWTKGILTKKVSLPRLRAELELAVTRQLMCDVPFGVLISGGLDSSLIAAIAAKQSTAPLHSFAIGLQGSPDLHHAAKVAKHIGTIHHEITFTIQEGEDALRDVISHLETFDVTTVRAATPMYLMARKIKSLGIKMILSGEGADEVFGGYLYFHMAPSAQEFQEETVRKVLGLSKYDCLRANKSMAAWGIEARVPFLDKEFLEYAMAIDPEDKMCSGRPEKFILRKAFEGLIPDEILWRQKEQFSDGVGYGWIDHLKKQAGELVSDTMMEHVGEAFPVQTPTSKEGYRYRMIFDEHFKSAGAATTVPVGPSIACSSPTAFRWSQQFAKMDDPSGRAIPVHKEAIKS